MDESLQELETELKSLQPRRASPAWLNRIQRDLAAEVPEPVRYASATNLPSWKWQGWRTAGLVAAAAVVALAIGLISIKRAPAPGPQADPAPVAGYQPVAATNVLYDLKDEGPVKIDGTDSARQVRARYVDTYTWRNPQTNASLRWSVPRDEIRVLPASYNPN